MSDYTPTNVNLLGAGRFATTHWSVVMAARQATVCQLQAGPGDSVPNILISVLCISEAQIVCG